jgi:hypothetical protein
MPAKMRKAAQSITPQAMLICTISIVEPERDTENHGGDGDNNGVVKVFHRARVFLFGVAQALDKNVLIAGIEHD